MLVTCVPDSGSVCLQMEQKGKDLKYLTVSGYRHFFLRQSSVSRGAFFLAVQSRHALSYLVQHNTPAAKLSSLLTKKPATTGTTSICILQCGTDEEGGIAIFPEGYKTRYTL